MQSGQQTPAQSGWRRPQADQHHHAPPCVQRHPPLRYKCCASTAPAAHTLTLLSQEQSQNLMLCKLKNDSDWAENGEIIKKRSRCSRSIGSPTPF